MDVTVALPELVEEFKPILSKPVTFKSLYDDYFLLHPSPRKDLASRMKDWSTRYPAKEVEIHPAFGYSIYRPFVLIFRERPRYVDIIAALADQYPRGYFGDNDILNGMRYVDEGWFAFVSKDREWEPGQPEPESEED